MKIKAEDILGTYDLKVDVKKSEPACMQCLPPKPMKDHKSLNGVIIHERIDVKPGAIYVVREKQL